MQNCNMFFQRKALKMQTLIKAGYHLELLSTKQITHPFHRVHEIPMCLLVLFKIDTLFCKLQWG